MKLLDFLRNHNELAEILIEGTNPYATQRLPHADVDTLRNQLATDERIRTHAQGRCVGEGRTSWVVTSQALLVMHTGRSAPVVRRIARWIGAQLVDPCDRSLQVTRHMAKLSVRNVRNKI